MCMDWCARVHTIVYTCACIILRAGNILTTDACSNIYNAHIFTACNVKVPVRLNFNTCLH